MGHLQVDLPAACCLPQPSTPTPIGMAHPPLVQQLQATPLTHDANFVINAITSHKAAFAQLASPTLLPTPAVATTTQTLTNADQNSSVTSTFRQEAEVTQQLCPALVQGIVSNSCS